MHKEKNNKDLESQVIKIYDEAESMSMEGH